MESTPSFLQIFHTDAPINRLLSIPASSPKSIYTRHFNHLEEFFLELETEFSVPSFAIHHDVRKTEPDPLYLTNIRETLSCLVPLAPTIFHGLAYGFNPSDVLRPIFYKLYPWEEKTYLYLLRLDLSPRLQEVEIVRKGSNDSTPAYRSRRVYLEADIVPLAKVLYGSNGVPSFEIDRKISQTWIGEEGRGYFVQGIWIDRELSKFFSKLFLPPGSRLHPYYPYSSRYQTISLSLAHPEGNRRESFIPCLDRAIRFLQPFLPSIEKGLKNQPFSENLELFQKIKAEVPKDWYREWNNLRIRPYLNDLDLKEYLIEELV